ncbi:hypothetical protein ACIO3R_02770 [Streptomyces sp. NPDC087428]|uniref:hypothetical protein n=1 Tax=Streptomyces sp. NPDC087428 TaxID=3365788 RepID=UPI003830AE0B
MQVARASSPLRLVPVTTVSYVPGAHGPEECSRRLGFRATGELSGDQVVAELEPGPVPRP